MSEVASASPGAESRAAPAPPAAPGVHHPRSFKLRFAAQREPGRSYVSLVKPRGLPATVTGKFYARSAAPAAADEEGERRALRTIRDMFERGPRDRLPHPLTTAHEYGWWGAGAGEPPAPCMRHHLRDSAWLKERLRLLAEDARLAPPH